MKKMDQFTFFQKVLLLVIPENVFLDYEIFKLDPNVDCVLVVLHQRTRFQEISALYWGLGTEEVQKVGFEVMAESILDGNIPFIDYSYTL